MGAHPVRARRAILPYLILAALLAAAVAYQVRVTEGVFPRWFHRSEPVHWPFLIVGDAGHPFALDFLSHAAESAGLRRGDELVAVNGRPVKGTAIYGEALAGARAGGTLTVTFRRGQRGAAAERTVSLTLEKREGGGAVAAALLVALPVFCIALGFWVAFVRPRDPLAWLLLALLLSFGASPTPFLESWGPGVRDAAAIYHTALNSTAPIWIMLFGIYFPEPFPPTLRRRWWDGVKWALGLPLALCALADIVLAVGKLENYARVAALDRWLAPAQRPLEVCGFAAVACFFGCVATKYRLAVSPDAQRRLRLLYFGALVCFTPLLILVVVASLRRSQVETFFPWWVFLIAYGMISLFPVLLAYLIVVHRAMDVRVVIRQGLQYALAKGGIRLLRVAIAIGLGFTIVSLLGHVGRNSLAYYVTIAAGIAVWISAGHWFKRLRVWTDRRFFRDAYNAEQILSELGDKVRSIVETRPLLATVAERIAESLHVARVAVLIDGSGAYRPAYAVGYPSPPEVAFADNDGLIDHLRRANEPAKVYLDDPGSWVYRAPGLTDAERAQLAALDAELLLPLSVKDRLLGFISLGPKRSEEPYSGTDLRLLKSVAAQTGLALDNARLTSAIARETAQRERLNREIEIAREVQERLFPQHLPAIAGLDYGGKCRPALGVGGDYYDFLALPEGRLGIALGDVSGKGIAAALMMASLQASLRAEAMRGTDNLALLVENVGRLVFEATAENRYATFFYAQYDPAGRRLSYVNAGHNPPILLRRNAGRLSVDRLTEGGTVIGLLSCASYRQGDLILEPGDLLVAFTDGVSETMNGQEEEWGEEALIRTLEACDGLSAGQIIDRVLAAAGQFAAGADQHDDMTLVVVRVCG